MPEHHDEMHSGNISFYTIFSPLVDVSLKWTSVALVRGKIACILTSPDGAINIFCYSTFVVSTFFGFLSKF